MEAMDRSERYSRSHWSDNHASTSTKESPDKIEASVTAEGTSRYDLFTLISSCNKYGIPIVGISFFSSIELPTTGALSMAREDSQQKFSLGEGVTSEVMQHVIRQSETRTRLPPQATVALKVFRLRTQPDQSEYTGARRNILLTMLREINVYSHPRLSRHPNIVRLLFVAWWPENAFPALAMELSSFGSLDDAIKASHFKLSILQMQHITIDIAMGLYAIHSVGFVHGDLKPDNVLLMIHKDPARGIIAKITDFGGSAKEMTGENNKPTYYTRLWAAPEVENQDVHVDWKKADVYSYGLIISSLWASNGVKFFDLKSYKRSSFFLSNILDPALEGSENDFLFHLKSQDQVVIHLSGFLLSTDVDSELQKEITEFVEGPLKGHFWLRPTMEKLLVHLAPFASSTSRDILAEKGATDAEDDEESKAQKNALYKSIARDTLMNTNGIFLHHMGLMSECKSLVDDKRHIVDMPIQLAVDISDGEFLNELLRQLSNTTLMKEINELTDLNEFSSKGKLYKTMAVSMLHEVNKSKTYKSTTHPKTSEEEQPSFTSSISNINTEVIHNLRLAAFHGQCISFATCVMAGKHKEGEFPVRLFLSLLALYRSAWAIRLLSARWPSYTKILRRILRSRCLDLEDRREEDKSPNIRSLSACLTAHITPRQAPIPPLTLDQALSLGAVEDIRRIIETEKHTADVQKALPTLLHRLAELTDNEAVSLAWLAYKAGASLNKLHEFMPSISCDGIFEISPDLGLVSPLGKAIQHGNVGFALEILRIHVEFQEPIIGFKDAFRISVIYRQHSIIREFLRLAQAYPALLQDADNNWSPTAEFFGEMLSIAVCQDGSPDSEYECLAFHGGNYAKAYRETLDILFIEFAKYTADAKLPKDLVEVALKSDNLVAVEALVQALRLMVFDASTYFLNLTVSRLNLPIHYSWKVSTALAACTIYNSERCFEYLLEQFPELVDAETLSYTCRKNKNLERLRSIFEACPDAMAEDMMGNNPLLDALQRGNVAAAEIIAEFCLPLRLQQLFYCEAAENTPIFFVILETWFKVRNPSLMNSIRWLIKKKAVHYSDADGKPFWAYILAQEPKFHGRTHQLLDAELFDVLLDVEELYEGATTTAWGSSSVLHAAAVNCHLEIVKLLIDKNVKISPAILENDGIVTPLDVIFHLYLGNEIPEEIQQGGVLESRKWLDNLQAISLLLIEHGCTSSQFDSFSKEELERLADYNLRQQVRAATSRYLDAFDDSLNVLSPHEQTLMAELSRRQVVWQIAVHRLNEDLRRPLPRKKPGPEYSDPSAISYDAGSGDDGFDDGREIWKQIIDSPETLAQCKTSFRYQRLEWRLPPNWTVERVPVKFRQRFNDAEYIYRYHTDGKKIPFSFKKPPLYCGKDATSSDTESELSDDTSHTTESDEIGDEIGDEICDEICDALKDALRDVKRPIIDRTPYWPERYQTEHDWLRLVMDLNQKNSPLTDRILDDGFSLGADCPPLHSSLAQSDDPDTVEALLQSGADLNQVYSRHTPVSLAVVRGRVGCMMKLLNAGANANSVVDQNTQTTLLHLAARHGQAWAAMGLQIAGADIEAKDANSRTPIMEAVDAKQWHMVEFLKEKLGADASVIKGHVGPDGEFLPRPEGM